MSHEMLNLRQAAEHVHMDANELRHVAQRGEIEFDEHGGDLWFAHRVLDEWAQRNLLASGRKEQLRQHRVIVYQNDAFHEITVLPSKEMPDDKPLEAPDDYGT